MWKPAKNWAARYDQIDVPGHEIFVRREPMPAGRYKGFYLWQVDHVCGYAVTVDGARRDAESLARQHGISLPERF